MKVGAAPAPNWVVEAGLVGFFPKSNPNRIFIKRPLQPSNQKKLQTKVHLYHRITSRLKHNAHILF
ncbi:hypothetical protein CH381_01700 [Leptospira sp. mixed culture ATI2-C-A1]|nr:hypothetical protein CH381_01700 [Leptospira sp. mixed culture ATI2-C-A1]